MSSDIDASCYDVNVKAAPAAQPSGSYSVPGSGIHHSLPTSGFPFVVLVSVVPCAGPQLPNQQRRTESFEFAGVELHVRAVRGCDVLECQGHPLADVCCAGGIDPGIAQQPNSERG